MWFLASNKYDCTCFLCGCVQYMQYFTATLTTMLVFMVNHGCEDSCLV